MPDPYRFGRIEVRPAERQVLVDGAPAALGARAFDVLLALIERHDHVVGKGELFDAVWPGLVVEDNNLQVQVSTLRRVLGPNAIATIPGRGYKFVATLGAETAPGAPTRPEVAIQPGNLPQPRTRFIGREAALADCTRLLGSTRLLTLSGIGGCGKTRLAQELAQRQLGAFPDGVWFVDLGPLQEAQGVTPAVAATLGVRDESGASLGRLADRLRTRRTLVVLDNCEHVIEAAAESVDALLSTCGELKIIATSREALGMSGEQIFAVRSLSLPATAALDEIRRSEAVQLFADHARLVLPDFTIDESNGAGIAEICRRLDGIALAIELAAARVRMLSIEEIRARLDDRFRLLTGGTRALPRHQTLQATMQWSHDHLTPAEQRLFRRLAVFAGGCTLAAAIRAAGDSDDEYDVLEGLTALHDKSLLIVDRDSQAEPRYRMLETVRQYANDRLNEAREGDEIRTRHLVHYVALAEEAASELAGPQQAQWFAAVRHEQENFLAAHAWCAHAPRGGELALRLAGSLCRYFGLATQPETGYRLGEAALALAEDGIDSRDRCKVLQGMARFAVSLGRYDEAAACAERCLAIARRLQDGDLVAGGLIVAGVACHAMGDAARALAYYTEACDIARATNNGRLLSAALNQLAEVHRANGNFEAAESFYEESIALARVLEDPSALAGRLDNLACLQIAAGKHARARTALRESRAIMQPCTGVCVLTVVAAFAASVGDHPAAARFNGAAQSRMDETQVRREPVDEAFIAPLLARARENLGDAAFEAAAAEGRALGADGAMAEVDRWLRDG